MPGKVPDQIGNYQILREIGRGGMGVVYLATDPGIKRRVALKMLPAELAADETTHQRFLREIAFLSTLEHPHIVPTYGVEVNDSQPFLVMRYLPGGTLREKLAEKSLSRAGLWQMLRQIARALDYAHGKELVHRDVKPTNILFDDSGNAYISDFGIAKAVNSNTQLTLTASLTGTPEYMSPEQFQSHTIDGRADQYSLAIILYEALAEKLPFQGDTFRLMYQHVYEQPPAIVAAAEEISPSLAAVVDRALAKNPADRFESVVAFIAAAEEAAQKPPKRFTTHHATAPQRPSALSTTGKPAVIDTPVSKVPHDPVAIAHPVIAADDFAVKAPVRIVTGAGGQEKSAPYRRRSKQVAAARDKEKPASGQQKKPLVSAWTWLVAAAVVLGLLFIFARNGGGQSPAKPDQRPAIAATTAPPLPTAEQVAAAELPDNDDGGEFIRIVENGVETDNGWVLPDDGAPIVVATGNGQMQLRFAGGSDLYLAPDTEVMLARFEDGYRVQFDSGEIVFNTATDAPVYLGNRLGSWVLVREPGALVGVTSRVGQSLEFVAHCFVGGCNLKGDLHDTPLQLMTGEAGRVGSTGVPEGMGPADYGRFASLADIVPTSTATLSPTATTPPTATRRPTATRHPTATMRPPATIRPPITVPTLTPIAPPATIAQPTSTAEPPLVTEPAPPPVATDPPTPAVPPTAADPPTPTAADPPTAAAPPTRPPTPEP